MFVMSLMRRLFTDSYAEMRYFSGEFRNNYRSATNVTQLDCKIHIIYMLCDTYQTYKKIKANLALHLFFSAKKYKYIALFGLHRLYDLSSG